MHTRVSFVLPAYKRRFLEDAIRAILAQTYRDFELIVVDDCSPENLKEVVDRFHDDRLTYHRNESNLGGKDLIAAWTHAMSFAGGEWCVLAGDDDIYEPTYLETMMELVRKYPACDLFHCRPGQINVNGDVDFIGAPRNEFESCIEMIYSRYVLGCRQTMPDFMFRRSCYEKVGGFVRTESAMHFDQATWAILSQEHGVVCSSKVLFYWRDSGSNISMRRDNAIQKVTATLQYRPWFISFVKGLQPKNRIEAIMKETTLRSFPVQMVNHMRGDVIRAPFLQWIRILFAFPIERSTKMRFVYDKFRALTDIAMFFR